MHNIFKKIPTLMIAALLLASSFASCDGSVTPDSPSDGSTAISVDTSAPETEIPMVLADFKITPELRIVYSHKAGEAEIAACRAIAQVISDAYGILPEVVSDWSFAEGPEILVGNCGYRENSVKFFDQLYKKAYGYAVLSENEIAISAGKEENITAAAQLFIDEVIKKNAEPTFKAGTANLKNNQKPAIEHSVNGVKISEYTIVADKTDNAAALYLAEAIKDNLYTELKIVSADSFGGGHAIKIGDFGCKSYGGIRYKLESERIGGVSTVYIDGDRPELWQAGAELLCAKYIEPAEGSEITLPEAKFLYKWPSTRNTALDFDKLTVEKELAEGVKYYEMKYINYWGENVDAYAVVVDGDSKAEFRVWAGDLASIYDGKEKMTLQTVGIQAGMLEKNTGDNVIAAINAGYFQIHTNGYPCGMRIIDGKLLCPPGVPTTFPDRWIGVTYDGEFVWGDAAKYTANWVGKIKNGVATGNHMIIDGKVDFSSGIHGNPSNIKDNGHPDLAPYSAIATTADGGFAIFCVDGRPWNGNGSSQGITSVDMTGIILDMERICPEIEVIHAFILDGGGSTELVTERKAGSSVFVTMNDPCDMSGGVRGFSRKVGDIIAVVIPKD